MKTIQMTDDVYRRLGQRAIPFHHKEPNDVIRWLLDEVEGRKADDVTAPTKGLAADLITQGGRVSHGTKLRFVYKGIGYEAEVSNGRVVWNGETYQSLSGWAVAVIRNTGSNRATEDGWRVTEYWNEKRQEWRSAEDLRDGSGP